MRRKGSTPRDPRRRVLMLANGDAQQTTGRLIEALGAGIGRDHDVTVVLRSFPRGVAAKLRSMLRTEALTASRAARSDVLVVHTALSLSLLPMAVTRLLCRPVIAYVWDIYPDSARMSGNISAPVLLKLYAMSERLGYRLASALVVLSEDYRSSIPGRRHNIRVMPPWPCDPILPTRQDTSRPAGVLRLGFAGQINSIRGLERGLDQLLTTWIGDRIELHVFSRDRCPDTLRRFIDAGSRVQLVEHGFLAPEVLQDQLRSLDMGWVCLDPEFALPAFPSKTMAYLSAGVPILYSGPRMPALEQWLERNGLGLAARDGDALSPSALDELRRNFPAARSAYLADMEDKWFDLGRLL